MNLFQRAVKLFIFSIITINLASLSYADSNFTSTNSAPNFIQINIDPGASLKNLGYFYCTIGAGAKPHLTAQSTLPLQTGVLNAKESVYLTNYAVMVSGFMNTDNEKSGTLALTVADLNKYAFAYYFDARLLNESPSVQIFVSRFDYVITCSPGTDNRPIYGAGHYG